MGLLKELLSEDEKDQDKAKPKKEIKQLRFGDVKLGFEYVTTATLGKISQGKRVKIVDRLPFGAQLQIHIETVIGPKIRHMMIGDLDDEIELKS